MNRRTVGELIFWSAAAAALALYFVTMPDGLPWNESVRLAMAHLEGDGGRGATALPHPIWGFYVKVFGGSIALSISLAALAAGLLGAVINRFFGWRFAVSAALVWIFLPGVWNRAITGERGIVLAAMTVVAVWAVNVIALWATRKARAVRRTAVEGGGGRGATALPGVNEEAKRAKINRLAGWIVLGATGLFVIVSATMHDYKFGEAASVYARGVVEAAGERVIVLNGVVDEQVVRESKLRVEVEERNHLSSTSTLNFNYISLRSDDANRANIGAWAKREWPTETNLWVAATVSPQAFVDAATKAHPERFYLMNGASATPEQWATRWEAFKPYLETSDRFVRVARRLFGYEGNAVANVLCDDEVEGRGQQRMDRHSTTTTNYYNYTIAWQLYKRVYEEVDPGNLSALVNMSEMIRRGYAAGGAEKKFVREKLEAFFSDVNNRQHAQRIVRASGPIRADPSLMERLAAAAKKRIADRIAAGEKVELAPELLTLIEWNNEMVELMNKGELVPAGRIARTILSNPKWHGFIPANAIMGTVASSEGDYVASERFFRVATDTTNKVAAATLNDFADTLMHLGKLDEAEKVARRAVKETDEATGWICRLTLAEVLEKKLKFHSSASTQAPDSLKAEIRSLLTSALKEAPKEVREKIRKEYKDFLR